MKFKTLALCAAAVASLCVTSTRAQQAENKYAILKLDDLVASDEAGGPVSPRFKRVADFLESNHIPGSIGVIGSSLEKDNPAYFKWIRERHDRGDIEFWLHSYRTHPSPEEADGFIHGTVEQQRAEFVRSEELAKKNLGFTFVAYGPHWTKATVDTEKAIAGVPELRIWLYGPARSDYFTGISYPRYLVLENPIFNPDFEAFKKVYAQFGQGHRLLVLQGHPDTWKNPGQWEGFLAIVNFLKSEGYTFTTPSDYARMSGLAQQ